MFLELRSAIIQFANARTSFIGAFVYDKSAMRTLDHAQTTDGRGLLELRDAILELRDAILEVRQARALSVRAFLGFTNAFLKLNAAFLKVGNTNVGEKVP